MIVLACLFLCWALSTCILPRVTASIFGVLTGLFEPVLLPIVVVIVSFGVLSYIMGGEKTTENFHSQMTDAVLKGTGWLLGGYLGWLAKVFKWAYTKLKRVTLRIYLWAKNKALAEGASPRVAKLIGIVAAILFI